jgi:hypothetical protein
MGNFLEGLQSGWGCGQKSELVQGEENLSTASWAPRSDSHRGKVNRNRAVLMQNYNPDFNHSDHPGPEISDLGLGLRWS